jgi:hypothetical protein
LCPYCGSFSADVRRCEHCAGYFDLLSRQRTQNAMGPWFIRDPGQPFRPGCSYETLRRMVLRGRVGPDTVVRGPTTRQFWSFARSTPGIGHLFGACHACQTAAEPSAPACAHCNAPFLVGGDREILGLAPVYLLPGEADPASIAEAAVSPAVTPTPLSAATSRPAAQRSDDPAPTLRPHAAPKRRSSPLPLLAVAASMLLAVVAIIAAVVQSRPTEAAARNSTDGHEAERPEPIPPGSVPPMPVAPEPVSAESVLVEPKLGQPEPDGVEAAADEPVQAPDQLLNQVPGPAPGPAMDQPVPEPAPQEDTATTGLSAADVRAAEQIAGATASELLAVLAQWRAESAPPEMWIRAADRRLEQIRLREAFRPQESNKTQK